MRAPSTGCVLLTLGRFPKGLDVARSFANAGWRVVVADPYKSHLMGVSRAVAKSYRVPSPAASCDAYLSAMLRIIEDEAVDLVIPVSEEVMYVTLLRDKVRPSVRIFAMPRDVLHPVHDKLAFIQQAAALDLSVPATRSADDEEASSLVEAGDFIIKQRHSCGGSGLLFKARGETFEADPETLVQMRLHGVEHSSCTLAHEGRVQGTVVYRGHTVSGTVAIDFERVDHDAIDAWVTRFVAATQWTGFISFDFIVDAAGRAFAIECNPRLTSGIHFFATDDLAKAILDPTAQLRLHPERRLQQFWSCLQAAQGELPNFVRFARNLRRILRIRDVTWCAKDPWPLVTMPWTAREILINASRRGVSLGIAASDDLIWTRTASTQTGSSA